MIYITIVQILNTKYLGIWATKKWQMYKSEYSEQCIVSNLQLLSFLCSSNPKYFVLKICIVVVYIIENVHDFFQIFLKLLNMFFEFFKIVGLLELGSTKSPLGILSLSLTRNQLARAVFVTTKISRERYRHKQ